MLNDKIRKDIERMGGRLLGKPDGLISNFTFKSSDKVLTSFFQLKKQYPEIDLYTRGRRLLVYGING